MSMIGRLCAATAIAAMLLLAGCGGDATHFYTLVRPTAPSTAGTASFAIDVQSVRLPLQVDQPELVIRQGDGAVALVETRRWIAPLPDEVRSALVAELTRQLGVRDISRVAPPPDTPVYRILVDVQRFDTWLARGTDLEAVWTVIVNEGGAGAQRWTCASSAHADAGPGYEALVISAQQALDKVAGQIGALIAAARGGGAPRCPAA